MKQEQNKNGTIGVLPKNLLMLLFSNLDLVSLINAAQVNKQWKTFLESDYTWKVIYHCPHHQKNLYHGKLWENLLQQAGNENANIEIVLTSYLKQVFALDLPQNETAVTFFTKCSLSITTCIASLYVLLNS